MNEKLAARAFLGSIVREALADAPDIVHFEHKLTGACVSSDNANTIAEKRADIDWREVNAKVAN